MPKLHIRCIAGLELAFSVAGPIEDRDTNDKRAEAAMLTPQKVRKKWLMPKLHIRCIAGLELAFSVAGPIEDRDTSDKRAEAAILTPQKSSKKMAYAKTAASLATDSNQHKVLGGPSGHNVKA